MHLRAAVLATLASLFVAAPIYAQDDEGGGAQRGGPPVGAITGEKFHTQLIRLGQQGEGLLYEPNSLGPKSHIALVFTHPGGNNFAAPIGRELANRGYRVISVNYLAGMDPGVDVQFPTVSLAVGYLRTLPGVTKVILSGHSGGAQEVTVYENVAEHGAAACNGPEKLFPCETKGLDGLQKPDGLIVIDPPLGNLHETSGIDPAVVNNDVRVRDPPLDMWSAANGYDAAAKRGRYSADFAKKYYAAQVKRNNEILAMALDKLHALQQGKSQFTNDEPLTLPGVPHDAGGARLFQADPTYQSRTKAPHLLLKADGTRDMEIIRSVRPPNVQSATNTRVLDVTSQAVTVKSYFGHIAIRLLPNFAITEDDIVGVDWKSAYDSAPGNADGITVPTLIMTMGCHYLMVPGELIYDRLASKDKSYATVEGATHGFSPCKPEYGDTMKRTFDYVDEWLSKDGRF